MKKRKSTLLLPLVAVIIIIASVVLLYGNRGDEQLSPISVNKKQLPIDEQLKTRIDSFIACDRHIGSLGLMAYDLTAQRSIYEYNVDSLYAPASCLKLLTCIATIQKYGRSYTYRNRLYTKGTIVGDTLVGEISLKLQFDPTFNRDSLFKLITPLKLHIKHFRGRAVIDMSNYQPMTHEQHWIIGDLKTRRLGLCYQGGQRMRRELQTALISQAGIRLQLDSIHLGVLNPHKATLISELRTPIQIPLRKALKNSSNINAESLLYLLGYSVAHSNYRTNGRLALQHFISHELHIVPNDVSIIHDGCGLCPDNRLTTRFLITLLRYAHAHKYIYKELTDGLAIAGTDGSLLHRLHQTNVRGLIRAKTGTLTREGGISTLTGYYTNPTDSHLIAFAIMNTSCPVYDGRQWQDHFCQKVLLPKNISKSKQTQ